MQDSGFPKGDGRPALGHPEGVGNLSYRAHVLLVQGSGFPKHVGRPSLYRPSDVRREPEIRVIELMFFWCRAPDFRSLSVVRALIGPRTSGGSRKFELYGSDFPGIGFRISEVVGRPALGRPEEAGCPRHWFCFQITAEQWRCGLNRK